MVAGTNICPSDMATDYSGVLFSTHISHTRGEYLCIDGEAKVTGSSGDEGGLLLYPVESVSGTGALQGYIANQVLHMLHLCIYRV
jgi:hypothetical protein